MESGSMMEVIHHPSHHVDSCGVDGATTLESCLTMPVVHRPLQLGGGPSKQAPAPDQPRQLGPGARARCRTGPVPGAGRMPRDPPGAVRPR